MTENERNKIEDILNSCSFETAKEKIGKLDSETLLQILSINYNWDDGFDIPREILKNQNCHLSTALLIFYLAGGEEYLEDRSCLEKSKLVMWSEFIFELYNLIVNSSFSKGEIAFRPPLSKVGLYKLKKKLCETERVFVENVDGVDLVNIRI